MAYVSVAELEALGVNPSALASFSDEQKQTAIGMAEDEANRYLAPVMGVPLTDPVPPSVKLNVARMALYNLFSFRGFDPQGPDGVLIANNKLARDFFTAVAKRVVSLGETTTPPVDDPSDNIDDPFVYSADDRGYSRWDV